MFTIEYMREAWKHALAEVTAAIAYLDAEKSDGSQRCVSIRLNIARCSTTILPRFVEFVGEPIAVGNKNSLRLSELNEQQRRHCCCFGMSIEHQSGVYLALTSKTLSTLSDMPFCERQWLWIIARSMPNDSRFCHGLLPHLPDRTSRRQFY